MISIELIDKVELADDWDPLWQLINKNPNR